MSSNRNMHRNSVAEVMDVQPWMTAMSYDSIHAAAPNLVFRVQFRSEILLFLQLQVNKTATHTVDVCRLQFVNTITITIYIYIYM